MSQGAVQLARIKVAVGGALAGVAGSALIVYWGVNRGESTMVLWGLGLLLLFVAAGWSAARRHWLPVQVIGWTALGLSLLGVMSIGALVFPGAALLAIASLTREWS